MGSLTLFIDSLPWTVAQSRGMFPGLEHRRALVPGHGYSINQYFELFGGAPPDAAGFFNVWNWRDGKPSFGRRLLGLLSPFDLHWTSSYLVRKPLQRARINFDFVPFSVLPYLERRDFHLSRFDFGVPTIFDGDAVRAFPPPALPPGPRDAAVAAQALREVMRGDRRTHFFFFLLDLDGVGHKHGTTGARYLEKLDWLDANVALVLAAYRKRHPENPITLLSDHGMTAITSEHGMGMRREFGRSHPRRYIAVEDATVSRVWVQDDALHGPLEQFLASRPFGRVLSAHERVDYGLTSRKFGDFIFILDEGGFFGKGIYRPGATPVAMHGYDPLLPSQHGVFLSSWKPATEGPVRSRLAHQELLGLVSES